MFLPLAVWSVFSLVYYGALFPNTAYAKLLTGIPRIAMIKQGFHYILVTLQQDPISIFLLFAAIFTGFYVGNRFEKALSVAFLLNTFYILWVGGDFMRGRFFTSALTLAILMLAAHCEVVFCKRKRLCVGIAMIYLVYLIGFPSTPLNTGFNYNNFNLDHGIADERGYYFDVCSLYSYLYSEPGEVFPDFEWSHIGRQIAEKNVAYLENDFNGMLGYWAGTKPIIIDRLALGDPFLARIPVANPAEWRIGHYKREVSPAYRQSVQTGQNLFPEGSERNLFELLQKAVAEKDLFSTDRFLAILRLNLRRY
jgi:arabinofuranosyltransferase